MIHTFQIRKKKLTLEDKETYFFDYNKQSTSFFIQKSQVLKFEKIEIYNHHTKTEEEWLEITVTDWIWNNANLEEKLRKYKLTSDVIISNETHFGIDWDFVIAKRRNKNTCFFCHGKIHVGNRTKDHLIAKAILRAYGYSGRMPNNIVPCCRECNQEKGSLHPEVYREFVKRKISETGNPKYRIIMFNLNKLLVSK